MIRVPVATVWNSPDAVRAIDDVVVRPEPDVAAWLARLGFDQRVALLGRIETQALMGEVVELITEKDGWAEVRLPRQATSLDPRGYPGWVPLAHLSQSSSTALLNQETVILTQRLSIATHSPNAFDSASVGAEILSMGTELPVVDRTYARVALATPNGTRWIDATAITKTRASTKGSALVTQATSLLGLPYLWGGLSGWGVDCSGLVHLSERALSNLVPRDSRDLRNSTPTSYEALPVGGELLFFRFRTEPQRIHHVAIAIDSEYMIHAPNTGRVVEILPIATEPYGQELERAATNF
jgi:gamma-D-glutamyl-L-lysine dipeptidyl-peptidase